ncbi:hypothetical protein ATK17_2595 [Branchiibius hedensis]|uniref:Uncharacterized protein n=2 Tax=Branchiibius hedensis TaxID=672460 RepID=A0A2Y8ZTC6_9MICO|nr:hypothetical protein ATK17_2595 [Branchiibius hedensis]SSA35244.1 hypothetical protein SAMN04489750_2595 [Branchiibius hedensis]
MAQRLVRVERSLKFAEDLPGFIVAVGDNWAVIQNIRDGGYFDGYSAFRIKDVVRIKRRKGFEQDYSRGLPTWPPRAPSPLALDNVASVLRSMAAAAQLVSIEQEERLSAQWIGTLVRSDADITWLHEVRPDATWHEEPLGYKSKWITLITIGSGYQEALAAVAGSRS